MAACAVPCSIIRNSRFVDDWFRYYFFRNRFYRSFHFRNFYFWDFYLRYFHLRNLHLWDFCLRYFHLRNLNFRYFYLWYFHFRNLHLWDFYFRNFYLWYFHLWNLNFRNSLLKSSSCSCCNTNSGLRFNQRLCCRLFCHLQHSSLLFRQAAITTEISGITFMPAGAVPGIIFYFHLRNSFFRFW